MSRQPTSWQPGPALPTGRLNLCVAVSGDVVFAVGGYNFPPPEYKPSVLFLNTSASGQQWSSALPSMSATRDSFGCGVADGMLYAVGGESANAPFVLRTVERLDLAKAFSSTGVAAQWEPVQSMHLSRSGHAVAVLDGRVYSAGGMANDPSSTVLSSVEAFDPAINRWALLPPMSVPRCYLGLVGHRGAVYAIGGLRDSAHGKAVSRDVEVYVPGASRWATLAPLPTASERMAVTSIGPLGIFVLGGCGTRRPGTHDPCDTLLDRVLCFSPPPHPSAGERGGVGSVAGVWSSAYPRLPAANAWFGAVGVRDAELFAVGGGLFYGRNATFRMHVGNSSTARRL